MDLSAEEKQPTVTEMDKEEGEVALLEKAYHYLTEKSYPLQCSKNEKRIIRRKAERLEVKDGVLHYKKKDGNKVWLLD